MKHKAAIVVLSLLMSWGFISGIALAAPHNAQAIQYDLEITGIDVSPPDPKAGEEVFLSVSYANAGDEDVDPAVTVYISLTVQAEEAPREIIGDPCIEKSEAGGLQAGRQNKHTFSTCNTVFPTEGSYIATAALSIDAGGLTPLADANPDNNSLTSDPIRVGPFESALPDELGRLFAGLGMFTAVMAIMAVGTEVILDTFKIFLGMKSKVTALETLDRFEKLMPGQLSTLGVDSTALDQFKSLTKDMRDTIQPVHTLGEAAAQVRQGDFGAAFETLKQISDVAEEIEQAMKKGLAEVSTMLDSLAITTNEAMIQAVAALETVRQKLGVSANADFVVEAKQWMQEQLDQKRVTNDVNKIKDLLEEQKYNEITPILNSLLNYEQAVFEKLKVWSQNLCSKWLENQLGYLQTLTNEQIMGLFEKDVEPVLENLGFLPPEAIASAKSQLRSQLSVIDLKAAAESNEHVESLRNLLDGVEKRRFDMQSPLRKMWRRIRNAANGEKSLALALGLVAATLLWLWRIPLYEALFRDSTPPAWVISFWSPLVGGLMMAVVYWLVLLLLSRLGLARYQAKLAEAYNLAQKSNDTQKMAELGRLRGRDKDNLTVLQLVEYLFNYMRGQESIDPHRFDKAPKAEEIVGTELSSSNAAQIFLLRTDQQRDEENSRLRWMRAVSVLIGMYLAYMMQIDAAELLDAAVPGIANEINGILNLSGELLHKSWNVLSADRAITAGIILTGLASSAGSAFWHDQLDRLQSSKKQAEAAAKMLQQAKQMSGESEPA